MSKVTQLASGRSRTPHRTRGLSAPLHSSVSVTVACLRKGSGCLSAVVRGPGRREERGTLDAITDTASLGHTGPGLSVCPVSRL